MGCGGGLQEIYNIIYNLIIIFIPSSTIDFRISDIRKKSFQSAVTHDGESENNVCCISLAFKQTFFSDISGVNAKFFRLCKPDGY